MLRILFLTIFFLSTATVFLPAAPYTSSNSSYQKQNQNQPAPNSTTGVLYYHPNCGHCHTVLDYLKSIHKTLVLKNTSNSLYQGELRKLGQNGVPVLVVGGSKVFVGSEQIINYLKQHPEILK